MLDLEELRIRMGKPVRLAWATRDRFWPQYHESQNFYIMVLCSASKRTEGAEMSEGGYIQGAGDDGETWALGLTPNIFWENKIALLNVGEENLPELIEELTRQYRQKLPDGQTTLVKPTNNIYIGKTGQRSSDVSFDLLIDCNGDIAAPCDPKMLNLGCGCRKLGSRDLRKVLDKAKEFVSSELDANPSQLLLVTCDTGKDLAVGTVLMVLCLFYDDSGKIGRAHV